MERKSFSEMDCSVAQCLEVVGEWWSMLIVRDTFMGVTRFEDFQRRLGISRNILRERLGTLVEAGVLERIPYSEHPPRYDYKLTQKGKDLWPVLTAMRQWGDQYAAPSGPPIELVHRSCGQTTHAELTCAWCKERLTYRNIQPIPGPGRGETLVPAGQSN
jgi:DNA-binding HxlR family transcriptional regulator